MHFTNVVFSVRALCDNNYDVDFAYISIVHLKFFSDHKWETNRTTTWHKFL